jgi:hypothetical protein
MALNVPPASTFSSLFQTNAFGVPIIDNGLFAPVTNPVADLQPAPAISTNFSSGVNYVQKYNELGYTVEFYLDNGGDFKNTGTTNRYLLNPAAIMNLTISEKVNDWVASGSMIVMYLPEDPPFGAPITLGNSAQTQTGAKENAKALASYQFRADGFDLLRVAMCPITDDASPIKVKPNDPNWYLSYLFSIYDVEDVTSVIPDMNGPASTYMKAVKLSFRDVREQILRTTNLEYSTALSPNAIQNPSLDNNKVLPTGLAINEIFNKALGGSLGVGCSEFNVPTGQNWDNGASQLFYTSPSQWTAKDDIEYLMGHHVSSTKTLSNGANDLCLLRTTRATAPSLLENIVLTPISTLFEQAGNDPKTPGPLQLEHFFVTTQATGASAPLTTTLRAPITFDPKSSVDLKTTKYGQILSYSFVDMSAEINASLFRTMPVYSVDLGKRTFNVEFKNNNVSSARQAIADTYIKNLYVSKDNSNDKTKLFLPTLHTQKQSLDVFPTFSLNGDNKTVRQKNGILDLVYTGLFQNACIVFKTFGLTLRKAGTFIGIDKVDGCNDDDYNDKLYGQWFVVKVDHVFEAGSYMNTIYAIKIHRYQNPKAPFGAII